MRHRVSVVIPTCNRAAMVRLAVASALAQTHAPMEVIVVIDGPESSGHLSLSSQVVLDCIHDPRLRVLPLLASVGGGEARNTGVRAASGDWIAFLDDDDLWLPGKLAAQLEYFDALEHPDTPGAHAPAAAREPDARPHPAAANDLAASRDSRAAVAGLTAATSGGNFAASQDVVLSCPVLARSPQWEEQWPRLPYDPAEPLAEYLFCRRGWRYGDALLQTSTLLIPRRLLLRLPFTPGLRKHQDWDWLLRAAADPSVAIRCVGTTPLVVFHVEGERQSVGRVRDWHLSANWALQRRHLFTPKALSAFFATECAAQAQGMPWLERFALLRLALTVAPVRLANLVPLVVFLVLPQQTRRRLRDLVRPVPSAHRRPA
ncbi:glycosyltransferase family 2 protein [Acidipila sp. EB88]|uniref:glycosyltransferase family 2 protein n=1 Tax=Acidipila sp. EB88 TaxID=2305226 RepID=UPI000F5DFCD0|nr:glycosyltransferase family 2 protein [Acidipila sp. EB88]RRA47326.1 glycosyltransferase family 2 protein [Acidipila sp. EB88]